MKTIITDSQVKIWLSKNDTYNWSHKPGSSWPCSQCSNKSIFAEFDSNGLVDIAINGKNQDIDSTEFNAIIADHLKGKLNKNHSCYFVIVGQFIEAEKEHKHYGVAVPDIKAYEKKAEKEIEKHFNLE